MQRLNKEGLGWSELLSAVAIVLSALALYQSHKANAPDVAAVALQSRSTLWCSTESAKWNVIAHVPLRVVNNGGRDTSLIGLRQNERLAPVVASFLNDKTVPVWAVFFVPNSDVQLGEENAHVLNKDTVSQGKRLFVNFPPGTEPLSEDIYAALPTGEPLVITMGFTSDLVHDGAQVSRFLLNFDLELGHGQRIPVQAVVEVPLLRGLRSCP